MTDSPAEAASAARARLPIVRPTPLREIVADRLIDMIVNCDINPGGHLNEATLAQSLGVSRQPVREALLRLSSEGWVDLRPGQGAFVHEPTDKEVDDLMAMRSLLETESARLAAANRSDADIVRLWSICHEGRRAAAAGDTERIVSLNADLHEQVTVIAGNSVLRELALIVDRRVRWQHAQVADSRGLASWDEHAQLIQAIADGDADTAAKVMRDHTSHTADAVRAVRAS